MTTLVKSNISLAFGQSLIEDCLLQKNNYYYAVGRAHAWDDDAVPPEVIDTEKYDRDSRQSVLYMKRISGASLSFVVPRVDYKSGIVYDIYDDNISLSGENFYVLNSNFNVYKCLYNGNGAISTQEPSGISTKSTKYSDGYVWKYVYTVTPALRNKFLTKSSMPIYNNITEKYYSRGSLNSIIINSSGLGYPSSGVTLAVLGDGFLEDNPQKITDIKINAFGAGYTTQPTAVTENIFGSSVLFSAVSGTAVNQGEYIKVIDSGTLATRYYLTETSGTLSSAIPSHYYSSVNNGSVSLKHVGTMPKLVVQHEATSVGRIIIDEAGFGYLSPPSITKSSPGTGATFTTNIEGGSLSKVEVLGYGVNYTNTTATVEAPYTLSTLFTQSTAYTLDTIVHFDISGETYYYRVDISGTSGASNPTHTTGAQVSGDVLLTVVAKRARVRAVLGVVTGVDTRSDVEAVIVQNGGTGYSTAPTIEFTGGNPISPAQGNAIVSGGKIIDVNITYPGYGYETTPTISILGGNTSATLTPVMQIGYGYQKVVNIIISNPDAGLTDGIVALAETIVEKTEAKIEPIIIDGRIRGVNIIDGGVGYTTATITVTSPSGSGAQLSPIFSTGDLTSIQSQSELFSIPGTVSSIKVISQGDNISTITATVVGDGTSATVTPVMQDGKLIELLVNNEGMNYTQASINFVVTGTGAVAPVCRVILSPINGHGYNPLKELYTKAIAIYGVFSDGFNNGVQTNNQYRQVMIYRNPLEFGAPVLLEQRIASACFNVSTATDLTTIPLETNQILTRTISGVVSQYRVISFTTNNLLLEALSDTLLVTGNQLKFSINTIEYTIGLTSVTTPQVDKYSGELLFINNIQSIQPTETQSISINTTFNLV